MVKKKARRRPLSHAWLEQVSLSLPKARILAGSCTIDSDTLSLDVSETSVTAPGSITLTATLDVDCTTDEYGFYVRRQGDGDWILIGAVSENTFDWTARAIGYMEFKVTAFTEAGNVDSTPVAVEVHYPYDYEIFSQGVFISARDSAWAQTVSHTNSAVRAEYGFLVTLDTGSGTWDVTAITKGPDINSADEESHGEWPVPSFPIPLPAADSYGTYYVGRCHTHTSMEFVTGSRTVGPSSADASATMPMIVVDYVATSGNEIFGGHPTSGPSSPHTYYPAGPSLISTPINSIIETCVNNLQLVQRVAVQHDVASWVEE